MSGTSDRPTTRVFEANPLRVAIETEPGNWDLVTDPRCSVQSLTLGCDGAGSQAEIQVWPGPMPQLGEGAMNLGDVLDAAQRPGFGTFLHCDQLIVIYRDSPLGPQWLFMGFCDLPEVAEMGDDQRSISLRVEGVWRRITDIIQCQVCGQRRRKRQAQVDLADPAGTDPAGTPEDIIVVPAAPCVFNPGGKPNRAPAPITASMTDKDRLIHVFTDPADPNAQAWTFAQALRYLVFWHLLWEPGDPTDTLGQMVADGNTLEDTESLCTDESTARPAAPPSWAEAFEYAMLGQPRDLNCDCQPLTKALVALAEACGIHIWLKTEPDPDEPAYPIDLLYVQARGAGDLIQLHREGTADDRGLDAAVQLELNDVIKFVVRKDTGDMMVAPRVVGDVRRYEIMSELVPGWEPDANLDDVVDVVPALLLAATHEGLDGEDLTDDPWFKAYHLRGVDFRTYANVGRRWVLNETGRYSIKSEGEMVYARNGHYNEDLYAPWTPDKCALKDAVHGADDKVLTADDWVLRARPLKPCFSADSERRSLGIVVEMSFDAGDTWEQVPAGAVHAIEDQAGIYLAAEDLTQVFAPSEDFKDVETSLWGAIIYDQFRLRVIAVIEGDARLEPTLAAAGFDVARQESTGRLFDLSKLYHSNDRQRGNSPFRTGGLRAVADETAEAGVDLDAIQTAAENILEMTSARQQPAALTVPWLTTDYEIGMCLTEITGLGLRFYSHKSSSQRRFPDVVAIRYTPGDTTLVTDDRRLLDLLDAPNAETLLREVIV